MIGLRSLEAMRLGRVFFGRSERGSRLRLGFGPDTAVEVAGVVGGRGQRTVDAPEGAELGELDHLCHLVARDALGDDHDQPDPVRG